MAYKRLLFRTEALPKVLKGATELADAIRITLGPKSKSVLIHKKWAKPIVCNDGVTIAKEIEIENPEENLGAQMMREVAERTGDAVGDGTTTATLLAHAIFSEGLKNIAAGASPVDLKRGLDKGLHIAVESLRKLSRPVKNQIEVEQIAAISAHNNEKLGKIVASAIEKVGAEGVVTLEESQGTDTTVEIVEGLRFDRGYVSSYFITDPAKMEAVLENPLIMLCEKKISAITDLVPLLEKAIKLGQPLVIIAEDVDGEALATLVLNKLRGVLPSAAVKSPGFGERKKALLEDMAILTGGKVVAEELGMKLENTSAEELGRAKRVVAARDATTIIGGMGDKGAIQNRIKQIKSEIEKATSSYDKEKLQERYAKLAGGVAVIRVGAPSETEIKSMKEAFDDSISATKAAMEEGVVPGGGLAMLRLIDALEEDAKNTEGDVRTGLQILKRALEAPARQIAKNSQMDDGVVIHEMRRSKNNTGFDAATGKFVDLMQAGIIDPTKVVRIALENAVSVASVLLLSEATLTEIPEPPRKEEKEVV